MSEQTLTRDSCVHYSNSPELFELFLDEHLNYSSGVFDAAGSTLDQAQVRKMDRIATEMGFEADQKILDIGCGWSGPAVYFAKTYGCRITGVTLSEIQREYGIKRASRQGVAERVDVQVCNVLNLPYPAASFDHIIFLESIIHMPEKQQIFNQCFELLRPGGKIFIQESHYDRAANRAQYLKDRGALEVDKSFGYTMDMVTGGEMLCLLEGAGLIPSSLQDISDHYVRTLAGWLTQIDANAAAMKAVSADAYWMLRRYLIIALNTYRQGGTVCYQVVASKR